MPQVTYQYRFYGLRISSAIELPSVECAEESDTVRDVTIRFGKVPDTLPVANVRHERFESADGVLLVRNPGAVRYLVTGGRHIVVEPLKNVTNRKLTAFLLGSAFGALLHQRGLFPLHACAVRVGDGCVAFVGQSTAGKSTLAAYLSKSGLPLVADDICCLAVNPGKQPTVVPGTGVLKLGPDTARNLNIPITSETPLGLRKKNLVPAERKAESTQLPLNAIYQLEWTDATGISIKPADDAIQVIAGNTYRRAYMSGMEQQARHFRNCAHILRTTPVFRLQRRRDFDLFPHILTKLQDHWTIHQRSETRRAA